MDDFLLNLRTFFEGKKLKQGELINKGIIFSNEKWFPSLNKGLTREIYYNTQGTSPDMGWDTFNNSKEFVNGNDTTYVITSDDFGKKRFGNNENGKRNPRFDEIKSKFEKDFNFDKEDTTDVPKKACGSKLIKKRKK